MKELISWEEQQDPKTFDHIIVSSEYNKLEAKVFNERQLTLLEQFFLRRRRLGRFFLYMV